MVSMIMMHMLLMLRMLVLVMIHMCSLLFYLFKSYLAHIAFSRSIILHFTFWTSISGHFTSSFNNWNSCMILFFPLLFLLIWKALLLIGHFPTVCPKKTHPLRCLLLLSRQ